LGRTDKSLADREVDDLSRAVFTLLCAFFEHFTSSVLRTTADVETKTVVRHLVALTFFDETDGNREIATMPLFIWSLLSEELVDNGFLEGTMEDHKPVWREAFVAFVQAVRFRVQWPPQEEIDGWPKSESPFDAAGLCENAHRQI
jgi:hypothetical protein